MKTLASDCWGGVAYEITQPFLPGPPAIHCGIDIGCPSGTLIRAARAGIVERVQAGMVGVHVAGSAQRDFYLHGYSLVGVGQHVEQGTPLIHSDTVPVDARYPPTGPHLHFEVQDGYDLPGAPPFAAEHPLDPVPVLQGGSSMNLTDVKGVLIAAAHGVGRGATVSQADIDASATRYMAGTPLDVLVAEVVSHPEAKTYEQGVAALLAAPPSTPDNDSAYALKTHVHTVEASKTGPSQ